MLWPDGKASANMANYAALFKSGYNAVKAISPASKVMVHISNGFDNALFRWNLDSLKNNGASWDIIGMSLYPNASNWSSLSSQCLTNMTDMVNRYGSSVMICEVGMSWTDSTACYSFVRDIINKTKSLSNNKGLGVFTGNRKPTITGRAIHWVHLTMPENLRMRWALLIKCVDLIMKWRISLKTNDILSKKYLHETFFAAIVVDVDLQWFQLHNEKGSVSMITGNFLSGMPAMLQKISIMALQRFLPKPALRPKRPSAMTSMTVHGVPYHYHDWAVELPFVYSDNFDVQSHGYKTRWWRLPTNKHWLVPQTFLYSETGFRPTLPGAVRWHIPRCQYMGERFLPWQSQKQLHRCFLWYQ